MVLNQEPWIHCITSGEKSQLLALILWLPLYNRNAQACHFHHVRKLVILWKFSFWSDPFFCVTFISTNSLFWCSDDVMFWRLFQLFEERVFHFHTIVPEICCLTLWSNVFPQSPHRGALHHGPGSWRRLFGLHKASHSKPHFIPVCTLIYSNVTASSQILTNTKKLCECD